MDRKNAIACLIMLLMLGGVDVARAILSVLFAACADFVSLGTSRKDVCDLPALLITFKATERASVAGACKEFAIPYHSMKNRNRDTKQSQSAFAISLLFVMSFFALGVYLWSDSAAAAESDVSTQSQNTSATFFLGLAAAGSILTVIAIHKIIAAKKIRAAKRAAESANTNPRPSQPLYHDYAQFALARELWTRNREIFVTHEGNRLSGLEKKIKAKARHLIIILFGYLGFVGGGVIMATMYGPSAGIGMIVIGAFVVCAIAAVEERRVRSYKSELTKRNFNEPEPLYREPPRRESPPKPETAQPPPEQEQASKTEEIRIISMRQAYEILGLPPGRITLSEAEKAYRVQIALYHPDRVEHLGMELKAVAARKSLQLNLAIAHVRKQAK